MSVSLQIRNVPEDVRDRLAERAKDQGKSVQAYLLELVEREARFGQNAAMFDRTAPARKPIPPGWIEGTVQEGRDRGLDLDRGEIA